MPSKRIDTFRLRMAITKEMNAIATDLMAEAKRQVPIDEGTLRRSAVKEVAWQGDRVVANVSFNTPYAAAQHEGDFVHPKGGKRKYLEDPLKAMKPKMARRLNDAYKQALK